MKSERLPEGTEFGQYVVQGLIGRGGMGQVYAARDSVYGTMVALKVLHPELHADEAWKERFNEEGLVGTRLKHPHVLSARELVMADDRVALVLDLVSGGQTLDKVMLRDHRSGLSLVPALQVFLRILQGIDYLHGKGIVHGDIKPENILLDGDLRHPPSWEPKVTDFGTVALIARPVEIDGRPAVVATPRYASPEHLQGVDHVEPRSDIYCLGLILHFLLTGRHASNAANVKEAAERTMLPVPILGLVDQPSDVIEVFKRATHRNVDGRYPNVRELALAVRDLLLGAGVTPEVADARTEFMTEEMADRPPSLASDGQRSSGGFSPIASMPVMPVPPELDEEVEPTQTQGPPRRLSSTEGAPTVRAPDPLVWGLGVVAVGVIALVLAYALGSG